jgi:hypothetical protein
LVAGIVMPRALRVPKRVRIEGARTSILSALRDCAVRSVASGRTVTATLDAEGHRFTVESTAATEDVLAESKVEASQGEVDGLLVPDRTSYTIPKGVEWDLDDWDADARPRYTFQPDGGASGPDLVLVVADRRFVLAVDSLTGRASIEEAEE